MTNSLQTHFYKRFEAETGIRVRAIAIELPDQWAHSLNTALPRLRGSKAHCAVAHDTVQDRLASSHPSRTQSGH